MEREQADFSEVNREPTRGRAPVTASPVWPHPYSQDCLFLLPEGKVLKRSHQESPPSSKEGLALRFRKPKRTTE